MKTDLIFKCLFIGWGLAALGIVVWFVIDCRRAHKFSKELDKDRAP